jgi:membrane protein YdbS with pleckstrin-like domain
MTSMAAALSISALALIRTVTAGVFIYITSSDNHFWHDNSALAYLVMTLVYMISMTCVTKDEQQYRRRRNILLLFTLNVFPLVYFYVDHKVNHTAGGEVLRGKPHFTKL